MCQLFINEKHAIIAGTTSYVTEPTSSTDVKNNHHAEFVIHYEIFAYGYSANAEVT